MLLFAVGCSVKWKGEGKRDLLRILDCKIQGYDSVNRGLHSLEVLIDSINRRALNPLWSLLAAQRRGSNSM